MQRRVFDLLFAVFCLALLAPVILVIGILIKLDSPGPIFYKPLMVGQRGRLFRLFRFRTMGTGRPDYPGSGERLTGVGRFIRNYSLDHLPTLLNLLDGSLTLIGPRPMEPERIDMQNPLWRRYFQAKPGLLNYAVLQLGNEWSSTTSSNPTRNRELELEYSERRSLRLDLGVFWAWMRAFLASRGNVKARGLSRVATDEKLNGGCG